MNLVQIAHVCSPFPEKFGVPRQSGLCPAVEGTIVFEPEFSDINAVRFLEQFSHIWVLWGFNKNKEGQWSPTVRPPKLGGNQRAGVFATRSPFRPNPIGMSALKLNSIEFDGVIKLHVSGIDMVDGTPVYDIKPYLPYADCIENASDGISSSSEKCAKSVFFVCDCPNALKEELSQVLMQDPHPLYIFDESREFHMSFKSYNVTFSVSGERIIVKNLQQGTQHT